MRCRAFDGLGLGGVNEVVRLAVHQAISKAQVKSSLFRYDDQSDRNRHEIDVNESWLSGFDGIIWAAVDFIDFCS
jgi:hypothetical protein